MKVLMKPAMRLSSARKLPIVPSGKFLVFGFSMMLLLVESLILAVFMLILIWFWWSVGGMFVVEVW
jgi:hypothetical protein